MKFEIKTPSQVRPKRRAVGHDALFEGLASNPGQWFAITSQPSSEMLQAKMFSAAAQGCADPDNHPGRHPLYSPASQRASYYRRESMMRRAESAAQDQKLKTLHALLSNRNASIRRVTGMRTVFPSEAL